MRAHKGPCGPQPGPGPNPDRAQTRARAKIFETKHPSMGRRRAGANASRQTHKPKAPQLGWGPVRVGARSGLGPIWALKGPPGQVLEKVSTFHQLSVKQFGPISHDSNPKLSF